MVQHFCNCGDNWICALTKLNHVITSVDTLLVQMNVWSCSCMIAVAHVFGSVAWKRSKHGWQSDMDCLPVHFTPENDVFHVMFMEMPLHNQSLEFMFIHQYMSTYNISHDTVYDMAWHWLKDNAGNIQYFSYCQQIPWKKTKRTRNCEAWSSLFLYAETSTV